MNTKDISPQSNITQETKRKSEKQPPRKLKSKDYFVMLHDPIQHAASLSAKAIDLYEAIKHFLKNKEYTQPSLEQLGEWAKIKSRTTLSQCRKELVKVGLIKFQRRGFKQSNRYEVAKLTDEVVKKLHVSHETLLLWIAEDDERARQKRQVKRDLKAMKQKRLYVRSGDYKKAESYPQIYDVQKLDTNVFSSRREENTISSIRLESKIKIGEKRTGAVKIADLLPTKEQNKALLQYLERRITPLAVARQWAASRPPGREYKPFGSERLIGVTTEIALKLGDMKNLRSNIGHTHNIFKLIKPLGHTEGDLSCMMYTALSLTQKHEGIFKTSPMAYLYAIVERAYSLKTRIPPP